MKQARWKLNPFMRSPRLAQVKNAILTFAAEAAAGIGPEKPEQAMVICQQVIQDMARVKDYRPKTPRPYIFSSVIE